METPVWNPFHRTYKQDPVSFIREIREKDPVNKGINGRWILTRYEDVKRIAADPRFIAYDLPDKIREHGVHRKNHSDGFEGLEKAMTNWILYLNPPDHTLTKKIMFRLWNQLDANLIVELATRELLEEITGQEVDFIERFATPMPVRVINELVGLENRDPDLLRTWSFSLSNTQEPFSGLGQLEEAERIAHDIIEFVNQQIEIQSRNSSQDNYLSAILHSEDISREELVSMVIFLFIAGVETTVTFFGNVVSYFISNPEVQNILANSPDRLDDHVEELVRLNNSARYIARLASEDCQIGGKEIKRGETVYLSLYGANHDPEVFEDPDTFKIRERNPHLSFGHGAHHCMGAMLSRLELKVFLEQLLEMGLSFESTGEKVLDQRSVIFRRVLKLPVRVIRRT